MSICTGFRPANYIQAGDDVVFVTESRQIPVKVLTVDKITGLSVVDDGNGSFVVPIKSLKKCDEND